MNISGVGPPGAASRSALTADSIAPTSGERAKGAIAGGVRVSCNERLAEIFARWRSGEQAAGDALVREVQGLIGAFLRRYGLQPADADDAVQGAAERVITYLPKYKGEASGLASWLFKIARSAVIDERRSWRRRMLRERFGHPQDGEGSDLEPWTWPHPETTCDVRAAFERVSAPLEQLSPEQREAFLLHVIGGLTSKEIAELTGANPNTVRSRVRLAKAFFARAVAKDQRLADLLSSCREDDHE
jgi:RNA polymerase sigma-70 factor (ECF subfamily)